MAQQVSINRESNKIQSTKSKRRRKCHGTLKSHSPSMQETVVDEESRNIDKCSSTDDLKMLEANKFNKLQKHRWKLNENAAADISRSSRCLMANNDNISHQCCPKSKIHQQICSCCMSKTRAMTLSSSFASNYRMLNITNMMTASSVKKLLPIFILVNMLPFLYAGESLLLFKYD
jgi:hypothetical protein